MTPEVFNELMQVLEAALKDHAQIETVSLGVPADDTGTLPELYVFVKGYDLCLTASPL